MEYHAATKKRFSILGQPPLPGWRREAFKKTLSPREASHHTLLPPDGVLMYLKG
jgi:hypothetical protein